MPTTGGGGLSLAGGFFSFGGLKGGGGREEFFFAASYSPSPSLWYRGGIVVEGEAAFLSSRSVGFFFPLRRRGRLLMLLPCCCCCCHIQGFLGFFWLERPSLTFRHFKPANKFRSSGGFLLRERESIVVKAALIAPRERETLSGFFATTTTAEAAERRYERPLDDVAWKERVEEGGNGLVYSSSRVMMMRGGSQASRARFAEGFFCSRGYFLQASRERDFPGLIGT